MQDKSPILLFLTPEDQNYIQHFKPFVKDRMVYFITQIPTTGAEIEIYAKSKGIKFVISTSVVVLNKIIGAQKHQNLDDWAGSLYERNGITYLFLNPLKQLFSVPYGKFITERFTSKLITPQNWKRTPEFSYDVATPESIETWYQRFSSAILIAIDIETFSFEDTTGEYQTIIRCVCYTGLWVNGTIHTIVIPIHENQQVEDIPYWIAWMRKFNNLPCPKIFQNGLYDTGHMLCYNAPVRNYLFDTQSLFHSWFSELPKRLDFITAFCVHNSFYWKDLGKEQGKLFEYNARDGWATLCSFLTLIAEMPEWAIRNYYIKFPLWVPCCYCNMEGVRINGTERERLISEYKDTFETVCARLRVVFGQEFNPNSPKQVTSLMQFYGSPDITSSSEEDLTKFSLRHPLNARYAGQILKARGTSKIISTYLKPKGYTTSVKGTAKPSYLLKNNRMFYALNPDGTDTGRLSCKESIFWTGSQVMNQPEETKALWEADDGFILFEADNETSESYCSGYSSGDPNLLATLLSGKDFHATNAERFFGVPYDKIITFEKGVKKILDKELRNLSKRTNHGATYDMMWFTLLSTMGEENVDRAKALLKLPSYWNRRKVCEYLLESYDKAYPTVRNEKSGWYGAIVTIVRTCHILTSPLGWTRYCFGDPTKSKRQKDSLIAHIPQNMSVGIINEGFKELFWKLQVPNSKNFRLKAQVHDSILGQVRIGYEKELLPKVISIMTRPTKVKDLVKGIERIMTIPVTMKVGHNWASMETFTI
jgi:hypothetical protein